MMEHHAGENGWHPLAFASPKHGLPGHLVALEGVDGSGKSTLIDMLLQRAGDHGVPATFVRVPSNGLRDYPLWRAWADESIGVPPSRIEGFGLSVLALGDRLCLQSAEILPALESGHLVVCDRYILSSLVYECSDVHRYVLSRLVAPDVGILVDADASTIMARLRERTYEAVHSRDEVEKPMLIERYRVLARMHGYRVVSTDGLSPNESFASLLALLPDIGPSTGEHSHE